MADSISNLLSSNAEFFAAGKTLGLSDDEVLSRIELLERRKDAPKSGSTEFQSTLIDGLIKDKFKGLEDARPSGRDVLRAARKQVGPGKYRKLSPEQRGQAVESVLLAINDADRGLKAAKSDDPTRIMKSVDSAMPSVVGSVEQAENDLIGAERDWRADDEASNRDSLPGFIGGTDTGTSSFAEVAGGFGNQLFDEGGVPIDPTVDAAAESEIARNTYLVYDDDGNVVDRVIMRPDEPIPQSVRDDGRSFGKFEMENKPFFKRVAGVGEQTDVYRSAPYDAKPEYNVYLLRDETGKVRTFSRTQSGELVDDPNGSITVKRVNPSSVDAALPAGDPNKQQTLITDDQGMVSQNKNTLTPAQELQLRRIAAQAEAGTLPERVTVTNTFLEPELDARTGADRMYYQKNPAGGAPIRVYPTITTDSQRVGEEAIRLVSADPSAQGRDFTATFAQGSGDIFMERDYRRGRQTAIDAGPRLVINSGVAEADDRLARLRRFGRSTDGMIYPEVEMNDNLQYVDDLGRPIPTETPDREVVIEMDRYSPVQIERRKRATQIGEGLTALGLRKGKRKSDIEENVILAQELGLSVEEVAEGKKLLRENLNMGQSPRQFVDNVSIASMASGDYDQVDIGQSLSDLTAALRKKTGNPNMPEVRTFADAARRIQEIAATNYGSVGGADAKRLTGEARFGTGRADTFTPDLTDVLSNRISARNELLRVVEEVRASGRGTAQGGGVTYQDAAKAMNVPVETIEMISKDGKEAEAVALQIKENGLENVQLPESIQAEITTPVKGGFVEAIGSMDEFKDFTKRGDLIKALVQLKAADESNINPLAKQRFEATGDTLIPKKQGTVGTGRVTESEKLSSMFGTYKGDTVAQESGKPIAQAPRMPKVKQNADGTLMSVDEAVASATEEMADWKQSPEYKQDRINRLKRRQEVALFRQDNPFVPERPQFSGAVTESDPSNRGLQEGLEIAELQQAPSKSAIDFERQQRSPASRDAIERGVLRAQGGLTEGTQGFTQVPIIVASEPKPKPRGGGNPSDPLIAAMRGDGRAIKGITDRMTSTMRGTAPSLAETAPTAQVQAPPARPVTGLLGGGMRAQAPALPAGRVTTTPQPAVNSEFILPRDERRRRVFGKTLNTPVSQLPPVSRPVGAEDPGTFVTDSGERRSYGGSYDGPTPPTGGEPQAQPQERAGDIIRMEAGRRQEQRKENAANNRRSFGDRFRRGSIGRNIAETAALGAAGLGAGVGIGQLIRNERDNREEQN